MVNRNNKVLAVWGSPSSGKTLVSAKLANYITNKGYDVALVLCDMDAPPLHLLVPLNRIEEQKSLGSILAAIKINENLILQNSITVKKNDHISIIGMLKGENKFTYPKYTQVQASELIEELREIVDFVIVDCSSHLSDDILSTVALIESDCVLRLINCDLKSVSYLSSQLPLLADSKFKADKQLKVANDVKTIHSNENIEQVIGGVTFTIPHSDLVEKQYLSGELLLDTPIKRDTKEFRQVIEDIAEEVFDL